MLEYRKNLEKYNLKEPSAILDTDFETIKNEIIDTLKENHPNIKLIESDDFMPLIETFAYREMYLRNSINVSIKKMLPHYSSGVDLDNFIFSFFGGIQRLEDEDDFSFLQRARLSLNAFSTAGSEKSYIFHTKSFDDAIYDVKVYRKAAGTVVIVYAAKENINNAALLEYLSDEKVRPLTDKVEVLRAKEKIVNLSATVKIYNENEVQSIEKNIIQNLTPFYYIGEKIIYSNLIRLLHVNGVYSVETNIKEDIEVAFDEVARVNLNLEIRNK